MSMTIHTIAAQLPLNSPFLLPLLLHQNQIRLANFVQHYREESWYTTNIVIRSGFDE